MSLGQFGSADGNGSATPHPNLDSVRNLPPEAQELLLKGNAQIKKADWAKAAGYLTKAWDIAPRNNELLIIVAYVLAKLGVRAKAIEVLEKALAIGGPTEELLTVMINLCVDMSISDVGEKITRLYISQFPGNEYGYNQLAVMLSMQDRFEESIAMLQEVLPIFPENPTLWNTLASHVMIQFGPGQALVFYEEALRLNPRDYRILNNISHLYQTIGEYEKSIVCGKKALRLNPKDPEPRLGLAMAKLALGQLKDGWRDYEARRDSGRRKGQAVAYTHRLPEWKGGDFTGKSMLLAAEQGLGDELLFSLAFPKLFEKGTEFFIGCDARLVSIMERSFPGVRAIAHATATQEGYIRRSFSDLELEIAGGKTKVDLAIPIGSLPRFLWRTPDDVPYFPDGHLQPNPDLVKRWRKRLDALGDGPKIGLSWRSQNLQGDRRGGYSELEDWGPVFANKNATFINLQYGECGEELANAEERFGVKIHTWDDFDIREDLEANFALMKLLDLAIGPASAPGMMCLSVGTPVWYLLRFRLPWWAFGDKKGPPFQKQSSFMVAPMDEEFDALLTRVGDRLGRFIKSGDPVAE